MLGALLAASVGGLEQVVLHRLWRRLSLGRALLVRAALYCPLPVGVFLGVSAAFKPWIPWNLQVPMILPVIGITFVTLLAGSTTIAEHIGHLRYRAFLRDFIEDTEDPLLEHGGDVCQYIGDEVVVTWSITDARSNARCLACHFAVVDAIERKRGRCEEQYGSVPSFRTGIHCGRVVAGEIGDRRKQIVFVGDVVNTASRAQAEAEAKARSMELF